ncbi:MAG: M6 family metalloprotease domain-containing protein [Dysgonamonadaceae bacterium]|jgi:M6 family metalloprotease-like protein|nr:M6 family metalloprotease domain-containing protein [Dysgonamonadaceae bacterium]
MKKKYYLIIATLFLFFSANVVAAPANPGLIKLRQPSGEEISVYLRGDEKVHWMESPDGYSLMYDDNKRIVFAVTDDAGNMTPSSIVYRDASLRASVGNEETENIPKNLRYSASQVELLKSVWNITQSATERAASKVTTGIIRAICPLVQFPDASFQHTREEFDMLMNQSGYTAGGAKGSVRDFYYENSYGNMLLLVDVVGPYTARHELSYYGKNDPRTNSHISTAHMIELAGEVADYVFKRLEITPADYDNDNDGYIDAFHFIYAGYGEESSAVDNDIWAHALTDFTPPFVFSNKRLDRYSCSSELRGSTGADIAHIGIVCHEMGHIFGLPDFYDTDYEKTGGNYLGTGDWDLMGGGSWNGVEKQDGSSPAHFNMHSKIQLGWVKPVLLNSAIDIVDMPCSEEKPVAYIYNTIRDGECYVFENRQKKGFDAALPGSGLLIYHVDWVDGYNDFKTVNTGHPQKMYPVCASSVYQFPYNSPTSYGKINSAGCPFPGTSGNTSFTTETTPAAFIWDGSKTGLSITEIKETNGLISFNFMKPVSLPIPHLYLPVQDLNTTVSGRSVLLTWEAPAANTPDKYVVYRNGTWLDDITADVQFYVDEVVPSGKTHDYCISAVYGDQESDKICVQYQSLTGMTAPNLSDNITIAPNTIKQGEVLTVDFGKDFAGAELSFYSVSGRLLRRDVVSEQVYRHRINFAPSVYILHIRAKSQVTIRKIIVVR